MNRKVLIFVLVGILFTSLVGILVLYSHEKARQEEVRREETQVTGPEDIQALEDQGPVMDEVPVKLFFEAPGSVTSARALLKPEVRKIATSPDKQVFLRKVLDALLSGPSAGGYSAIPPGTTVRQVFIVDTLAVVDFSRQITDRHPGGVLEELSTIYSIVNTITENIAGVERVRILVEGAERPTLAGHISIVRSLTDSPQYVVGWKAKDSMIEEQNLQ